MVNYKPHPWGSKAEDGRTLDYPVLFGVYLIRIFRVRHKLIIFSKIINDDTAFL
jgi:hypothetical protein